MKKFLTLLMVLCLVALPALADTTACDFGDFVWEIDNDMMGSIVEKVENTPFITLYPNYAEESVFHSNLNCVWSQNQIDIAAMTENDVKLLAETVLSGLTAEYQGMGYDAKAGAVVEASMMDMEQWGRSVIFTVATYQIDLAKTGEFADLYIAQVYVSAASGTYVFTATAGDYETDLVACLSLLDQIYWEE